MRTPLTRWLLAAVTLTLVAGMVVALVLASRPAPAILRQAAAPTAVPAPPAAPPRAAAARGTQVSRSSGRAPAPAPAVDPAWVVRVASATGIPAPAVRAYGTATLRLGAEQPSCGLGWTTLAALGYVESDHGRTGGRVLGEDGHPSTPIIGPALDGVGDVAAIRSDATATAWHGDPVWDHAVGPLQFLPSTWEQWGSDGDGDGVADPHDLDDAAYAAGRYLCAGGEDLRTGPGWSRAVFSYNHADVYVAAVHAAATSYAR